MNAQPRTFPISPGVPNADSEQGTYKFQTTPGVERKIILYGTLSSRLKRLKIEKTENQRDGNQRLNSRSDRHEREEARIKKNGLWRGYSR